MGRQKRSFNTYQKINTIFNRDINGIIMPYDGYVDPIFNWFENCKFRCEEKVDGTNIRFEIVPEFTYSAIDDYVEALSGVKFNIFYKGKTDNAQIPKMLDKFIKETYTEDVILYGLGIKKFIRVEEFQDYGWENTDDIPKMWTIYSEGYGHRIQACGDNYLIDSNKVIGFDVKVTNRNGSEVYLLLDERDEILNKMGMPIVPIIGYFTIPEAIEYVKKGYKSRIAEANSDFIAEGFVCKTPDNILDRYGNRIVFKVKTCDWNKYFNQYGTYDKVEQILNEHY